MTAAAYPTFFCLFYNLKAPPVYHLQNFSFVLYPVNTKICPDVNAEKYITFNLYTRHNPFESEVLQISNKKLLSSSHLNINNPTVIFFHGFTESHSTEDSQAIKSSFLSRGDYNVILVDVEILLAGPYYKEAVINCRFIGKYGALFIDFLVGNGLHLPDLHVIGFSLGAQISGFVGQYLQTGKLFRITGLDPAGPFYNHVEIDKRLDPSDADFVDVIHSNRYLAGYIKSCDHVDFWPNGGGPKQPGCSFRERTVEGSLTKMVFCEHFRSYRLFVKSVNDPYQYLARNCNSYKDYENDQCNNSSEAYMGIAVDRMTRGNFFIYTGTDASDL